MIENGIDRAAIVRHAPRALDGPRLTLSAAEKVDDDCAIVLSEQAGKRLPLAPAAATAVNEDDWLAAALVGEVETISVNVQGWHV